MNAPIKLMIAARTAPHRARADALAHLKRVHGPMVYDPPADAGAMPSRYVQNHALPALLLPPALDGWRSEFDLVTEIYFGAIDHLRQSTSTPYYKNALQPDESNFVDQSTVRPLVVMDDHQEAGEAPDAACKLFVYLKASGPGFSDAWQAARAMSGDHVLAQHANLPLIAPGAPPPFASGVWELWFADQPAAQAFATDHLLSAIERLGDHLIADGCFVVMADEYNVTRLRRENV